MKVTIMLFLDRQGFKFTKNITVFCRFSVWSAIVDSVLVHMCSSLCVSTEKVWRGLVWVG